MEEQETLSEEVIIVKKEEIGTLSELGFKEEEGLMVFDTASGSIGVDKENGVVAVQTNGPSVQELAIVSEMVSSKIAEVVDSTDIDVDNIKEDMSDNNS